MDKLADDLWRLEVMPDVITNKDPFEKASPKKEVTKIGWRANRITFLLSNFKEEFEVRGANKDNFYLETVKSSSFQIQPGVYLLLVNMDTDVDLIRPEKFYAPSSSITEPII
ncbi:MAG TPA: hypothetical protein VGB71_02615, partial [Flavisolibacter sp.]